MFTSLVPYVQAANTRHRDVWDNVLSKLMSDPTPPPGVAPHDFSQWSQVRKEQAAAWSQTVTDPVPTSPTKVLFAGDWHGSEEWAGLAAALAAQCGAEVVVQAGDLGVGESVDDQIFLDMLESICVYYNVTIVFVDGNHDNIPHLHTYPQRSDGWRVVRPRVVHAPRGHRWVWGSQTWAAFGGATSLDAHNRVQGVSWWPEEEISKEDYDTLVAGGPVDVLVTHDAPPEALHDSLDPTGWNPMQLHRAALNRLWLRDAVTATHPQLVVHGHFHRFNHTQVTAEDGHDYVVLGLDRDGSDLGAFALYHVT